ncbi:MAG: DUF3135 domain-containing protein [Gammaproteobacteria bacterium]|nr:DUF3135 domain-containing protein [Gammaproteobacteria bacterium]
MSSKQHVEFIPDFDQLAALAQDDPESFEAVRRQCIESFIQSVSEKKRQRLTGLQWQIDQRRELARNPMASCIAISNMMWDSLHNLNSYQRELLALSVGRNSHSEPKIPADTPTVVPFRV